VSVELLRDALARLPRADHVRPDQEITRDEIYVVPAHRAVLDLERPLVVANRGMGKSFWAHALRDPELRKSIGAELRLSELASVDARLVFNGGEKTHEGAVTRDILAQAASWGFSPREIFRAVVLRFLAERVGEGIGSTLVEQLTWQRENPERAASVWTRADAQGPKLLLVFDGLDRLGESWPASQDLLQGLLQVALEAQSLEKLRLKLFLRLDQFDDLALFRFADSSKLRSRSVTLSWTADDLYRLLFFRLERVDPRVADSLVGTLHDKVCALAGEFMGSDRRRGRVSTWVPTHLADMRGDIAPRTFLTAWSEAAKEVLARNQKPELPVDPKAIHRGVQLAAEDRVSELDEDYPWVRPALEALKDKLVPIEWQDLEELWTERRTLFEAIKRAKEQMIWVPPSLVERSGEAELRDALGSIGVLRLHDNGKVNVPDIFRVAFGIGRRGGVPPRRAVG